MILWEEVGFGTSPFGECIAGFIYTVLAVTCKVFVDKQSYYRVKALIEHLDKRMAKASVVALYLEKLAIAY